MKTFKKQLIGTALITVFFSVTVLFNELIFAKNIASFPTLVAIKLFYALSFGIFLSAFYTLIKKRSNRTFFGMLLLILLSLVFITETILFRAFGYTYPLETIFSMGNAVMSGFGANIVPAIVSAVPYIILFLFPPLLFLYVRSKVRIEPGFTFRRRIGFVASLLLCSVALNGLGSLIASSDQQLSGLNGEDFEFNSAVQKLGLTTALSLNIKYSLFGSPTPQLPNTTIDTQLLLPNQAQYNIIQEYDSKISSTSAPNQINSLHRYFVSRTPTEKNSKTGLFKGKNLIFVCAEALSPYVITAKETPTLYMLAHEGFKFVNYYSPTFGESTSGGEYALLLSQVPKRSAGEKGLCMKLSAKNDLSFSLPAFFRSNGYFCNGYHNNSYTYYDRQITHPALGLNWFGCGGCVKIDASATSLDLGETISPGWPRSDLEMINATFDHFISAADREQKPFFTYYLTVSGHNNYSFNGNRISAKNKADVSDLQHSERVKAYIASQLELEKSMKSLIEKLEEKNLMDDTVIVIANDHHPYGLSSTWAGNNGTDYLSELYGKTVNGLSETERGSLIIYCKGLTDGEPITKPVASFDVLPTLLNLFGFEFDSRLFCGKDVFGSKEGFVFFSDGSFVSSLGSYNGKNGTRIGDVSEEHVINSKKYIQNTTRYSMLARQLDYFRYLSQTNEKRG